MAQNRKEEVGPAEVATLVEVLKHEIDHVGKPLSTAEVGRALSLTQQAASSRLLRLEEGGYLERSRSGRGFLVRLTIKGVDELRSFQSGLSDVLDRPTGPLHFEGTVFAGLGEGGYYVSQKGYERQFVGTLGFKPYPGTLNLRLTSPEQVEQRRRLQFLEGIEVLGFKDKARTYGPVKCFRAKVKNRKAAALAIQRTHYDYSVLEVIAPERLRDTLGLKEGDRCAVDVFVN
ncbi:MAG: CTP-dependent riboflavin kinase [Thaumarchaeota archaeon]|nr:CTP-dependent riboflavin kinase [Nitrososphaerota archaeon]